MTETLSILTSYSIRIGVDKQGPDQAVQQATTNLFMDMSISPKTPVDFLVLSGPSSDGTPPISVLQECHYTTTHDAAVVLYCSGTCNDDQGFVAALEFSADGLQTWHPVSFNEEHTKFWFTWDGPGALHGGGIFVRAIDDTGNMEGFKEAYPLPSLN